TLKYIVLLGDLCLQILYALRLRSVGRNNQKHTSAGGVLGVTFLKSREMAGEMFQAMECRGFEGEYVVSKEKGIHITDVIYLLAATVIIVIYVYLW
ncbi:MAG: energy-coupling factor transporter transmembrane protein EcfT, partial [Lachnospiraceae bacterium]|nr:energy-coupling factor transporter transmembrane protein EcfT [Lachnospiraceae bacterium]